MLKNCPKWNLGSRACSNSHQFVLETNFSIDGVVDHPQIFLWIVIFVIIENYFLRNGKTYYLYENICVHFPLYLTDVILETLEHHKSLPN